MASKCVLQVDHRERGTRLLQLVEDCGDFDLRIESLRTGDYVINGTVVLERKGYADLATSIVDGRLFRQALALARSRLRSLFLIEGSASSPMPRVHPHAFSGAVLALAVSWRIPVIFSHGPEESLCVLRTLAEQSQWVDEAALPRYGYKPRRLESRKLYVLQGLPGIGPKLARQLLRHFGTVEKVMQAGEELLMQVPGCGNKKASAIRKVLG